MINGGGAPTAQVVSIDLRTEREEVLGAALVSDLQRRRAVGVGRMQLGRLLVLDDADRLPGDEAVLSRLLREARSATAVLVVAFASGGRAEDSSLELPPVLVETNTPVLWIGGNHAVPWQMQTPYSAEFLVGDDSRVQRSLLEALRVPEVFDQVVAAVSRFPRRVANPGLRVFDLDTELREATRRARLDAVRALTRREAAPPAALSAASAMGESLSGLAAPRGSVQLLDPNGPLARQATAARATAAAAGGRAAAVARRGLGARDLSRACQRTAGELSALRDQAVAVAVAAAATQAGQPPPGILVPPDAPAVSGLELRTGVVELLQRSRNLPVAGEQLRAFSARMLSRTDFGQAAAAACPDSLLEGLRAPPPPTASSAPVMLAVAAFTGLLACVARSAWPLGPALGAASLLLTAALIAVTADSRAPVARAGWVHYAMAGALGAGVGAALTATPWSRQLPVVVAMLLVALATGAPPLAVLYERRRLLRDWVARLPIPAAEEAVSALLHTVDSAVSDWLLLSSRAYLATAGRHLAELLDVAAQELTALVASDAASGYPVSSRVEDWLASAEPALAVLAAEEYLAVVLEAVRSGWRALESDDGSENPQEVHESLRKAMHAKDALLAKYGLLVPHPDRAAAVAGDRGRQLLGELWERAESIETLLLTPVDDPALLQLCGHEQLALLSLSPESAAVVRFAPVGVVNRQAATGASDADGSIAGVIRLVPLREPVVDVRNVALSQPDQVPECPKSERPSGVLSRGPS